MSNTFKAMIATKDEMFYLTGSEDHYKIANHFNLHGKSYVRFNLIPNKTFKNANDWIFKIDDNDVGSVPDWFNKEKVEKAARTIINEMLGTPWKYDGNLVLYNTLTEDLGNLTSVKGHMFVGGAGSRISTLSNLEDVSGSFSASGSTKLKTLDNLGYIGEDLFLDDSAVENVATIVYLGGNVSAKGTKLSKEALDALMFFNGVGN